MKSSGLTSEAASSEQPKNGTKRGRKPLWCFYRLDEKTTIDQAVRKLQYRLWLDVAARRIAADPKSKARFPRLTSPRHTRDPLDRIVEQAVRAYALILLARHPPPRDIGIVAYCRCERAFAPEFRARSRWAAPDVQLRELGKWLLIDGAVGLRKRQGPKPDLQMAFQTVTVVFVAAILVRYVRRPTPREAALVWRVLYDEQVSPDILKGRMRSVGWICCDFLEFAHAAFPKVRFATIEELLG